MFNKDFIMEEYKTLLEKLNEASNMGQDGALVVLEMAPIDYSLSQIAHLVEQNDAKVLHVFSYLEEATSMQVVILKIDREDASTVLRSFERFNYTVRYFMQKQLLNDETMQKRLDELVHYLEL